MANISASQWESLARRSFTERICTVLREHHPDAFARERSERLETWISQQARRAAEYGLSDERSAGFFIYAAWLLGTGFDRRIGVASQILLDDTLGAAAKAAALRDFLIVVFGTLDGVGRPS